MKFQHLKAFGVFMNKLLKITQMEILTTSNDKMGNDKLPTRKGTLSVGRKYFKVLNYSNGNYPIDW